MDTENADVELSDGGTDDSMDELEDMEEVSPSPVSLAGGRWPGVVTVKFPVQSYLYLMDGLNKQPTWTVYPKFLEECIEKTSSIVRSGSTQALSVQEETLMRKFLREGLSSAMAKCLEDSAVAGWSQDTQGQIMAACMHLVELAVAVLEALAAKEDPSEDDEAEAEGVLSELASAFDPRCHFHTKNRDEPASDEVDAVAREVGFEGAEGLAAEGWAEASALGEEVSRSTSPSPSEEKQRIWLVLLINLFGVQGGFAAVNKILDSLYTRRLQGKGYSISFLDQLISPLAKADEFLTQRAADEMTGSLRKLLNWMYEAVESDLEVLSDKGQDRMFSAASGLMEKVHGLLMISNLSTLEAEELVGSLQRSFIVRLLQQSSFSKHLCAVREINSLLKRALQAREDDEGAAIATNVRWMAEMDVVKHLLRANLHQKQYVDQVQKVLKNLTIEGGLKEDHLDLLWNLTEKVDTFEAVKNNIFDMLGDLAQDFNDEQLDLLFSKFQVSKGRPVPDSIKIMDLMRRLAKSDTKGVMAQRVMGLLWSMMMNPEAPLEVTKSPAITDALQAYAHCKGLVDQHITLHYMKRCTLQIRAGTCVLPAMSLLQRLACASVPEYNDGLEALKVLEKDFGILDAVISSLEAYLAAQRQATADAGRALPQAEAPADHDDAVREYHEFLLMVPHWGQLVISWEQVERLWEVLVKAPVFSSDRLLGMQILQAQALQGVLERSTVTQLLTHKLSSVDIRQLHGKEPVQFFHLFSACFCMVSGLGVGGEVWQERQGEAPPPAVHPANMAGLSTLWRLAIDVDGSAMCVPDAAAFPPVERPVSVADRSRSLLVQLYSSAIKQPNSQGVNVCKQFIDKCLVELLASAQLLTGRHFGQALLTPGQTPASLPAPLPVDSDPALASRRASRCLALLQDIVAACQGRTMPAEAKHSASFQGSIYKFSIQPNKAGFANAPANFRLTCHSHMYIGALRSLIAQRLSIEPEKLRIIANGRELSNDARLVKQEHLMDGSVIMVASCPQANSYTRPAGAQPGEADAVQPATLLSNSPELYDVLLCLADVRGDEPVRRTSMQLLEVMPTDRAVVGQLSGVLQSKAPCQGMRDLLIASGVASKPARLLYTLQALNALLFPISMSDDVAATQATQHKFINSGCIYALLDAVKEGNNAGDISTLRSLHSATLLLVSRLQMLMPKPPPSDAVMAEAPLPASSLATVPEPPADGMVTSPAVSGSSRPERASSPTAAVRVTIDGGLGSGDKQADTGVLAQVMLFHMDLATRAARRWGPSPLQDATLEEVDVHINQDAIAGLRELLEMQPSLIETLFSSAPHKAALATMVVEGLLNSGSETVRTNTCKLGERLAGMGEGTGHAQVLEMLSQLSLADQQPYCCFDYYRLLTEVVHTMPNMPAAVKEKEAAVAKALLGQLVRESASMQMVDEEDGRMEGKLRLLAEVVRVLDCRRVGSQGAGGLVRRIITEYLFPESWFLLKLNEAKREEPTRSVLDYSVPVIAQALKARCLTKSCTKVALCLLEDLMANDSANFREGTSLIQRIHLARNIIPEDAWEHCPRVAARKPSAFVGLKNAGATCYLNSVFQQLFMQPSIRRLILSSPELPPSQRQDSVFYQLQTTFASLAMSNREFFRPHGFWKAFKDYDGEPLNLREHQDAYEFFTRLQDLIDQHMRDNKGKPVMQLVMGGKFAQQIICRDYPVKSEKEEEFYQVSIDVRGKRTLEESLDFYVQGELMEGDNQYFNEELNKKVDAVKRNCIKVLPHMLVIHLKRFEYDYETMNRWKIKDRFEFPEEIDMYKYTVTGLEEREAREAAASGEADEEGGNPTSAKNPEECKYFLKGIVVHSGTAFAGHYYSYIKVRAEAGHESSNAGKWFCFDDNTVEAWDIQNLDKDCFGGKYNVDLQGMGGPKQYDRPNSAYMLFYERADSLEPVTRMQEATAPPQQDASPSAPEAAPQPDGSQGMVDLVGSGGSNVEVAQDVSSSQERITTVPVPDIFRSIPAACEAILENNLRVMQELRLLDRDYFRLMYNLVARKREEPFSPPSSMRRTEPAIGPPPQPGCPPSPDQPSSSRRGAGADEAAEKLMEFAALFLLRVYLKSSFVLRDADANWTAFMEGFLGSSTAANRWFLEVVTQDCLGEGRQDSRNADEDFLQHYLYWCEGKEAANIFAVLLSRALREAVVNDNALPFSAFSSPAQDMDSTSQAVHRVLTGMANIMSGKEMTAHTHQSSPLCKVLLGYASLGQTQRVHLIELQVLYRAAVIIYHSNASCSADNMLAFVEVIDILVRSVDLSHFLRQKTADVLPNPYGHSDDKLPRIGASKQLWEALRGAWLREILGYSTFWDHDVIYRLVPYLMWQNEDFTLFWLKKFSEQVRSMNADILDRRNSALVSLIALPDPWEGLRVKAAMEGRDGVDGLLSMACDAQLTPKKRFGMIRLIVHLVENRPQFYPNASTRPQWEDLESWLSRWATSKASGPSTHKDFRNVCALLVAIRDFPSQAVEDDSGDGSTEEEEGSAEEEDAPRVPSPGAL